jgi:hypothetical protein
MPLKLVWVLPSVSYVTVSTILFPLLLALLPTLKLVIPTLTVKLLLLFGLPTPLKLIHGVLHIESKLTMLLSFRYFHEVISLVVLPATCTVSNTMHDIELVHKPGKSQAVANALSRCFGTVIPAG